MRTDLPVHFFTIVLNGMPFLRHHIEVFSQLRLHWHWHVIEGVAELTGDTAWSVKHGGQVCTHWHRNGLSIDGTTEYIDELKNSFPQHVSVYRKGEGQFWKGKVEMVRAPLNSIHQESLLWQIDADEIWSREQIETMAAAFCLNPERSAAFFWCHYFVGEDRYISTRYGYSQNPHYEWLRVWRFAPGDHWLAHEPPTLTRSIDGEEIDVGRIMPFLHQETEAMGLVFDHYAYVHESQIAFKEEYYGYSGAVEQWKRLQNARLPVRLADFFHWVHDDTYVDSFSKMHACADIPALSAAVPTPLSHSHGKIMVDGVAWQMIHGGILRYWELILTEWGKSELADRIILVDRAGTAPRISGISTISAPRHSYANRLADAAMLEDLCRRYGCQVFASTYYTVPLETKSVFVGYDMIPEVLGADLSEGGWKSKAIAIYHAALHTAISQSSCQDLEKYYPIVAPGSSRLTPCALAPDFILEDHHATLPQQLRTTDIPAGGYILYVGERSGLDNYKNARILFEVLPVIQQRYGLKLLCVGGREELEPELAQLAPPSAALRITASDRELAQLYQHAFCMVVTSKYEGFGIPVIEAMQCGCPVICPSHSSLQEVGGDAALFLDTVEPESILIAIKTLQDAELRQEMRIKGRVNAARFTPAKSASALESALQEAFLAEPRIPGNCWRAILQQQMSDDAMIMAPAGAYTEEVVELKKQIRALKMSMSWRVTSPYRLIADKIKKI